MFGVNKTGLITKISIKYVFRHVFGNMSGGFRGISRFFFIFAGFPGNTSILQVRDRTKYQKP